MRDSEGNLRVRIHGHWSENRILLAADPDYPKRLAADGDSNRRKAWLDGSWDVVSGGFFDDVWDRAKHVLRPFLIPKSWRVDRTFDWGSAKPFSVGWWAESDGTPALLADGQQRTFPRGSVIRINEWYGWNGKPNEGGRLQTPQIAQGIRLRERAMGVAVNAGPADSMIFDADDGVSIADKMRAAGVTWLAADKGPGSRKNGWELMRTMLGEAAKPKPERPGLWVFDRCVHFIRTIPMLPRDPVKHDDVDTKAEDHVGDETRYRILQPRTRWILSSYQT